MSPMRCSAEIRAVRPQVDAARVVDLARSGMAVGLAGLFLEAHPDLPSPRDGPSALPLNQLEPF